MNNKKGKLTKNLMLLSVGPLVVFGIIVIITTSVIIYSSLKNEIRYSLEILANSVYQMYDFAYPGSFEIDEQNSISKGSSNIEERFDIADRVKEMSGADITLFAGDKRHITTIRDEDGERALDTRADAEVVRIVLNEGRAYFSTDVLVNDVEYFGYYIPIKDTESNVIGMLFAGKSRFMAISEISKNILMVCILLMLMMFIAVALTFQYGKNIIYSLNKTENFLSDVAKGDLTAKIDAHILERHDEIGEMGRFLVMIQKSIADLVGTDPLTGLPNRRSCDVVLESIARKSINNNTVFSVAMGDIDFFKCVNDTYGHQAGDEVLKYIADTIEEHMDRLGFVFRWGGEEFLLVYEDMNRETAYKYLKRIKDEIQSSGVMWNGELIKVTITFGLADSAEEPDIERIIELADSKLYLGKNTGRDKIEYEKLIINIPRNNGLESRF